MVAERMLAGEIEHTRYLRNPLDVLAQQIVAMCAVEERGVDELLDTIRRAAPFAELSADVPGGAGHARRALSERRVRGAAAPGRLGRAAGTVSARDGAGRIAITSGGTIPDRGLFAVFLVDGPRVGELDEEMVYESRRGDVIVLGASAWRIEDITRDRVIVTGPRGAGRMPFWHGDKPGVRSSSAARWALSPHAPRDETRGRPGAAPPRRGPGRARRRTSCPTSMNRWMRPAPSRTTAPSWWSGSATRWATGGCASCPCSARACTPRGRWRSRLGCWIGSARAPRCSGATTASSSAARGGRRILAEEPCLDPDAIEQAVVQAVPQTAMFASASGRRRLGRFCSPSPTRTTDAALAAAPALGGSPRGGVQVPGLPDPVGGHPGMPPATCSTSRRSARSWRISAPGAQGSSRSTPSTRLLRAVAALPVGGRLHVRRRRPLAERRAAALTLDRDCSASSSGRRSCGSCSTTRPRRGRGGAAAPGRGQGARSSITCTTSSARSATSPWTASVAAWRRRRGRRAGRAARGRRARSGYGSPGTSARRGRGRGPAPRRARRLPADRFAGSVHGCDDRPLEGLVRATPGPTDRSSPRRSLGRLGASHRARAGGARRARSLRRGRSCEFRPATPAASGATPTCSDACRRSLSLLRRGGRAGRRLRARPIPPRVAGSRPPEGDVDALPDAIASSRACPSPRRSSRPTSLPGRVRGYRAADLGRARGERRRGLSAPGRSDRRWSGHARVPFRCADAPRRILRAAGRGATSPSARICQNEGRPSGRTWSRPPARRTNASCSPLSGTSSGRASSRTTRSRHSAPTCGAPLRRSGRTGPGVGLGPARSGARPRPAPAGGRSSPAPEPAATTERAHALAGQLLDRHGVVTRESVLAEGIPGGFVGIYLVFKAMRRPGASVAGTSWRGSAPPSSRPGAVDRPVPSARPTGRWTRNEEGGGTLVLAAADPAQPYGPRSRGLRARAVRRARPGRTSCSRTARRPPTSSAEAGASSRSAPILRRVDALASLVKDGRLK